MTDELRCFLVSGPQPAATLKLSIPGIENPVFALADDDDERGGTIGTNIRFRAYLDQLSPDDPITLEMSRVTEDDVADAHRMAAEFDRQVLLLEIGR